MAERPLFISHLSGDKFVDEISISFQWYPGFAAVQKQKSIQSLHGAAAALGYQQVLEVSTKSERKLGRHLSAFNLEVEMECGGKIPLESAFQGSKVFENGGPFPDIYEKSSRDAKKDPRIRNSGKIIGFQFEALEFPSEPKTAFYDWIYIRALAPHENFLSRLSEFSGFTDIEFNPARSLNCQARSCALYHSLSHRGLISKVARDPLAFLEVMQGYPKDELPEQVTLF